MVSAFIDEYDGYLRLTQEQVQAFPRIPKEARVIFKYGQADGYCNNKKFLQQMKSAMDIVDMKYPKSDFIVWLFDQSSGHTSYSGDSLNVNWMNIKDGGKQPALRNTTWNGKMHSFLSPVYYIKKTTFYHAP